MSTNPFTVTIPGKFDGFFSGSSVAQGEGGYSRNPELQAGADCLHTAYRDRIYKGAGKGYSLQLRCLTYDAVRVLADYASTCIAVNDEEPDYAERSAARKVLMACETILAGPRSPDAYDARCDLFAALDCTIEDAESDRLAELDSEAFEVSGPMNGPPRIEWNEGWDSARFRAVLFVGASL